MSYKLTVVAVLFVMFFAGCTMPSLETITVKSGKFYEAKTGEVVVVEAGAVCFTNGNSRPTVTVEYGGWCGTYGDSRPEITEEKENGGNQ